MQSGKLCLLVMLKEYTTPLLHISKLGIVLNRSWALFCPFATQPPMWLSLLSLEEAGSSCFPFFLGSFSHLLPLTPELALQEELGLGCQDHVLLGHRPIC